MIYASILALEIKIVCILAPLSLFFVTFFLYIFIKQLKLDEEKTYRTLSGTTIFNITPQSTSCTGGTITDIYIPAAEDNPESTTFILTLKELRSCNGFEDISVEHGEVIIQSLNQLSALCYQAIIDERSPKI